MPDKRPKERESLASKVLDFIREHHLFFGKRRLLVAVSGGPDSVCLLHILVKLQQELGVELHAAHLNHQLRGIDSDGDAEYVRRLAARLGVPATVAEEDVKSYQAKHKLSPEEAAREARYNFLYRTAEAIGADGVVVGHTIDDHIETILLHIIRGTGTRGLRGLLPLSRWQNPDGELTIIRPLLQVSRQETAVYCRRHRLAPRLDTTNLQLTSLRNRIRHQLLPQLEAYNPGIAHALIRIARNAGDEFAFLEAESASLWAQVAQDREGTIVLDKVRLLEAAPALQRHILRMAIEKVIGNLKDIEACHIEDMLAALPKPAGKRLDLPGGLVFAVDYEQYLLGKDIATLNPFPVLEGEIALKIPGETVISGWRVAAVVADRGEVAEEGGDFVACLDLDKIGDGVVVRRRRPGDRFQPLGMSQTKLLGEFMIDAKIPRMWRERVPIVSSSRHILWVAGWRIDDRVKVTADTRRVLRLEFRR